RQHKKTAHNAIERRYRNNINDRIAELKNAVPALLYAKVKDNNGRKRKNDEEDDGEDGEEYLDGVAVATKLNKATILRKATEYINHLKKTGEDIKRENEVL
ncbi:HLH-domain-containing protein, partial [Rhizopus microsporus ATCC 52813]